MAKIFRILFVLSIVSFHCFAQVSEKDFDFLTKYYNNQYKLLLRARGIDTTSYFSSKYINQNDPSKIAAVLNKYYGKSNANVAALMYFYFDSTFFVFIADKNKVTKLSQVR